MGKPYKLLHKPSGLYYQPHKHRGSNISERGKIYQTKTHGLSYVMKNAESRNIKDTAIFKIQVAKNSRVHKKLKDILIFEDCRHAYDQLIANSLVKDWEIEEL